MKAVSKCIGCGRPRLVNEFDLCKRCNRHAFDFISQEEIERVRLQHEALLEAKAKKEAKKEIAKEEAGAEAEGEGAEGEIEGEEAPSEETEAETDSDNESKE